MSKGISKILQFCLTIQPSNISTVSEASHINCKKSVKIPKGNSVGVNLRTDHTMAKRLKIAKEQSVAVNLRTQYKIKRLYIPKGNSVDVNLRIDNIMAKRLMIPKW
jgi:hypothetical protein